MRYMRYGFIGLGNLGAKLAASLVKHGFDVTSPTSAKMPPLSCSPQGARWADDPHAVAEQADAVITCLPSPSISMKVLAGPRGVLSGLRPGCTWIEMSTNDQADIEKMAALRAKPRASKCSKRRSPAACIWRPLARSP